MSRRRRLQAAKAGARDDVAHFPLMDQKRRQSRAMVLQSG
jgi:hypothetical protein